MIKRYGLIYKLAAYILSSVIAIFAIVFVYNYFISRNLLLKNVEENTKNITTSAINKSEGFFRTIEKLADNLRLVRETTNPTDEEYAAFMKALVAASDEVFGSCIAYEPYKHDPKHELFAPYFYESGPDILYANLAENEYNYPEWDWYQIPKILGKPCWSEPYNDEGGGNVLMTTYSIPYHKTTDSLSGLEGILTVDVSIAWLQDIVSKIKIFETGYAFLISRTGTIITHPKSEYIMNESIFSLAEESHDANLREIGRRMTSGGSGFEKLNSVLYKGNSWIYYSSLTNNGWSIGFIFPESELYADLYALNTRLLIMAGIGFICLFSLILFISKKITTPISRLARAAHDIGQGNFEGELPRSATEKDEIDTLKNSFLSMQQELKDYIVNLQITTKEKEKIERDLHIANQIQLSILPVLGPEILGRKDLDIYGFMEPAREVGGDLYDFILNDGKLYFAIGDVSGKGVPAALYMAITTTLFRSKAHEGALRADEIVGAMNDYLCEQNDQCMFVTFFAGVIDLQTGQLNYFNAGHNYPYILRSSGRVETLAITHTPPLGIDCGLKAAAETVKLGRGDLLLLYTDGINEAFNSSGEQFTDEAIVKTLEQSSGRTGKETVEQLIANVKKFVGDAEQSDDMTVLAIRLP